MWCAKEVYFYCCFLKTKKETKKLCETSIPKFMYGVRKIENKMTSVIRKMEKNFFFKKGSP